MRNSAKLKKIMNAITCYDHLSITHQTPYKILGRGQILVRWFLSESTNQIPWVHNLQPSNLYVYASREHSDNFPRLRNSPHNPEKKGNGDIRETPIIYATS